MGETERASSVRELIDARVAGVLAYEVRPDSRATTARRSKCLFGRSDPEASLAEACGLLVAILLFAE